MLRAPRSLIYRLPFSSCLESQSRQIRSKRSNFHHLRTGLVFAGLLQPRAEVYSEISATADAGVDPDVLKGEPFVPLPNGLPLIQK